MNNNMWLPSFELFEHALSELFWLIFTELSTQLDQKLLEGQGMSYTFLCFFIYNLINPLYTYFWNKDLFDW